MPFAVIDTNVLVSYFVSKAETPPVIVVRAMLEGRIVPVYNTYLLKEYRDVLSRDRFGLDPSIIDAVLDVIEVLGLGVESYDSWIRLPDQKDAPVFDIALSTRDVESFLVTGNTKHFPGVDYVITPKQMADLLQSTE